MSEAAGVTVGRSSNDASRRLLNDGFRGADDASGQEHQRAYMVVLKRSKHTGVTSG